MLNFRIISLHPTIKNQKNIFGEIITFYYRKTIFVIRQITITCIQSISKELRHKSMLCEARHNLIRLI